MEPTTCKPCTGQSHGQFWLGRAYGATHLDEEEVERDVECERDGRAEGHERAQRTEVGERVVV